MPKLSTRSVLPVLLAINLCCYLDRYLLAAVLPSIKDDFLRGDPDANSKAGLLTTVFMVSYMIMAPIFGKMADRFSRWLVIGISVAVWSLACGASGLAQGFMMLLMTRVFLGIGEAGYAPAAPVLISEFYPLERRGRAMAWFYMAIPVGSALGYAVGGSIGHAWGWRWPFFLMTPVGFLMAIICFWMPSVSHRSASQQTSETEPALSIAETYKTLLRIPSLVANIAAQTAMTFAVGGLAVWAPTYFHEDRGLSLDTAGNYFGAITAIGGLTSTLAGGWLADYLRDKIRGAYFLVSGVGMLLGFPAVIGMLYLPFPWAWVMVFIAIFFLFLNTGPCNTAIANVTPLPLRASAYGLNILICHLLGDAFSPWLIGWVKDHSSWTQGFLVVSTVMLVSGAIWLVSMKLLIRDTEIETKAEPFSIA